MTTSDSGPQTADPAEISRFNRDAAKWWDETGPMAPLHAFNPVRIGVIRQMLQGHFGFDTESFSPLEGLRLLDIGCGAGLVAEPMARLGARVTGVDAAERAIDAARVHAALSGLPIDYRVGAVEALDAPPFDIVLALEVVEHVQNLHLFLAEAAARVRPGGVFVAATLNRTARSFALAVVGAEYVLRWLPRGTHRWAKFIRPSELIARLTDNGLRVTDTSGFAWRPLSRRWAATDDLSVNYMVGAVKA